MLSSCTSICKFHVLCAHSLKKVKHHFLEHSLLEQVFSLAGLQARRAPLSFGVCSSQDTWGHCSVTLTQNHCLLPCTNLAALFFGYSVSVAIVNGMISNMIWSAHGISLYIKMGEYRNTCFYSSTLGGALGKLSPLVFGSYFSKMIGESWVTKDWPWALHIQSMCSAHWAIFLLFCSFLPV